MIASSPLVKLLAGCGALVAHAALAMALLPESTVKTEGSSGAAEVRLGTAFADMSAGTLQATPAESAATPAPNAAVLPEAAQVRTAETAAVPSASLATVTKAEKAEQTPSAPTTSAKPAPAASQASGQPSPTASPERVTPLAASEAVRPAPSVTATPVVTAPALTAAPAAQPAPAVTAVPAIKPETATPTAKNENPTTLEANPTAAPRAEPLQPERLTAEPDSTLTSRSLRPRQRSAAFEEEHKPRQVQRQTPKTTKKAKPQPKGGQPKRAGAATGTPRAKANSSGSGQKKRTAGNAAASNYPGQVMRRVAQVGRVRVNVSGAAVVAFTISSSGRLAALSLARSSGNAALDKAALRQIRRAVPFPKPPAGAQRSFRITIQGQ